jgi:hypothetical protein
MPSPQNALQDFPKIFRYFAGACCFLQHIRKTAD